MVDTPTADTPREPDISHVNPADGGDLVRPSAPAGAAVHHRDVGAVRLLRHAGDADALSRPTISCSATSTTTGLYGGFTALVYLTPLIGGLIADRYLGSKRSVKFGAIMMALGYFTLCFGGETAKPLCDDRRPALRSPGREGERRDAGKQFAHRRPAAEACSSAAMRTAVGRLMAADGSEARTIPPGPFEADADVRACS